MNATTTMNMPVMNRGAAGEIETFVMANCRSLIENAVVSTVVGGEVTTGEEVGIMYDCKVCGRKFKSFQALGGHRASHKKWKPVISGDVTDDVKVEVVPKFKNHKCKICDAAFASGQALGGHMRKHKDESISDDDDVKKVTSVAAVSGVTAESSDGNDDVNEKKRIVDDHVEDEEVYLLKKTSSSCKRVCLGLDLDLSLWWKEELLEEYFKNNAGEVEGADSTRETRR